jgi:hypothetical protein
MLSSTREHSPISPNLIWAHQKQKEKKHAENQNHVGSFLSLGSGCNFLDMVCLARCTLAEIYRMSLKDEMAIAEAWMPGRKPKKQIQNQLMIMLILAEALPLTMTGTIGLLYLISIFPLTVLALLSLWLIGAITYIGYLSYRRFVLKLH